MELDAVRCYQAVLSRDRRFDGRFFTAVVTTGIYCRPTCPVAPAKPGNVRFFACAAAAEAAGFRPCRRCRPEAAPGTPAWLGTSAVVSRALRLIAHGGLDESNPDALAARLGIGARQLRRLFATHLGASPVAIARARRVHFARRLLDETELPITQVAFSAGFASIRQFNHAVRATFGAAPSALRKRRAPQASAADGDQLTVRLPYRPPFDWAAMVGFLLPRATPGVEVVTAASYTRTIAIDGVAGTIEVRPGPDGSAPSHLCLTVQLPGHEHLMRVVDRVRRMFDLDADPLPITQHLRSSPELAPHVRACAGVRVPGAWDGFELAVRAVLGQQVTVRGATTLAGRLVQKFGLPLGPSGSGMLTHLFPRAAELSCADLGSIGLPSARAATIRALAVQVCSGELVLDASSGPDETVSRLCKIPGIGEWTAQYIAMRALNEPDAFPATDLGLRRALGNGAGPVSAQSLARLAEGWRPWRAYAAMCLWTGEGARRGRGPVASRSKMQSWHGGR
jgi:AraC family transcriptional regulator of adaptative response / DNA-3-methyladenine glycosylase II